MTERWGVLAYADEDGNAVAIRPLAELTDSIFTRIGHGRLRFVVARLVDDTRHPLPGGPVIRRPGNRGEGGVG